MRVAAAGMALVALACAAARADAPDLVVALKAPAQGIGKQAGTERVRLGEVRDEGFAEAPDVLGMGPGDLWAVRVAGTRASAVRQGIESALRDAGVLADDAPVVLDVTIRRMRFDVLTTAVKMRLRGECFLEVALRREGAPAERVLACGTAQIPAQIAGRPKVESACRVAFEDALFKISNSRTLAKALGPGWTPKAAPAVTGEHEATRIAKDQFYGPSAFARSAPAKAGDASLREAAWLPDWSLEAVTGKKDEHVDVALARGYVPALVAEHLQSFYPGAFARIERSSPPSGAAGVVVTGRLDTFRIGSLAKQIWVGMGAGKDKLAGTCSVADASSGTPLASIDFRTAAWGAGWQAQRGGVRDMADQLACDLAYRLVRATGASPTPAAGLEVLFDGDAYPAPSTKLKPGAMK